MEDEYMQTRRMGKSDIKISALGMGCWAIGGPWTWEQPGEEPFPAGWGKTDDQQSIRAIHAALDLGINFFDTAANYGAGHSERILGRALAERRSEVIIATKFGHVVNETEKVVYKDDHQVLGSLRQDCENSLRRLGTDYIDIYQFHEASYNPELAPQVMDILEQLVLEGEIRYYGWSTDLPDRAAIFTKGEHYTAVQFALNVNHDNEEMRSLCADFDLGGINKSPLNKGILTGKFNTDSTFPEDDIRHGLSFIEGVPAERLKQVDALREVLTAGGHTLAQAALAYIWALDERMVPIPGFKTVKQVEENAGALELGPLSAQQMGDINEVLGRD
jgi:aryl-alcohol dehydrogenase-like predicted oxidoreductase